MRQLRSARLNCPWLRLPELLEPSSCKRPKQRLSKLMRSSCKKDEQKSSRPPSWEAATLDFLCKVHHEANEFEIYEYTLKRFNRRSVHRCLSELRSSVAMTHSNCLDPLRDMPSESVGLLKKENSDAQSLHAEVKKSLAHDGTGAMCASVSVKKDVDESIPYHANLTREIYVISDDDDDVTPRGTGTPYLRLDGYEENDGEPDVSDDELKRFFYEANEVILFFAGTYVVEKQLRQFRLRVSLLQPLLVRQHSQLTTYKLSRLWTACVPRQVPLTA